jgi:archaemetzincin
MGEPGNNGRAIFFLWLYFVSLANGFCLSSAKCAGVSDHMASKILLLPIGKIDGWMLDALEKDLEKTFNSRVQRHSPVEVPKGAFNPARGQYSASFLLNEYRGLLALEKQDKALAITDVDLYAPGLNFVFGEAESGGQFAVISLTRLRQSFYSLPENQPLFTERAIKEAVHELGHVWGLGHCPNPFCVMHFSNSLSDTDKKSASFCLKCQARLEKTTQ